MDYNIVALEIADHIAHLDYYNRLVSTKPDKTDETVGEQQKIINKSKERLENTFPGVDFYTPETFVRPLPDVSQQIIEKLQALKTNEIHDLVDKLERDEKKMKKLYKSMKSKSA